MLKVLRDSMKYLAWILWAVIAVFVLFVFVDFGSSVPQAGSPTRAAATVGDREISYREFEREYRQLEDQMKSQLGAQFTPELAEQLRLPMQALDRVINREILLAEASRMGLAVGDEEVRETILSYPAFKGPDGRFVGEEAYTRTLRSVGYDPASFEEAIRQQILVQRLTGALGSGVVVSPAEVEERYRQQVERAKIRFVQLPYGEVRAEVQASDDEVRSWFESHQEQYRVPEERVARYLLVDQRQLREGIEIADDEVKRYYDEHQEEFREPEQVQARHVLVSTADRSPAEARERIEQARARIAGGEPFATVAAEMSDDPGSAARGGDLGWFGRGRMVPEFEQAAFGAATGTLTGPVQSQFGFHLIQVTDRRPERVRPLDEAREVVRSRLAGERAESEGEALAKTLRSELGDTPEPEAFEKAAATRPAVQAGETQPFRAQGAVPPLGAAPVLNQTAFALQQGALSEPVRTPQGWVVMQVSEVRDPRIPELSEVEAAVRRDVETEKASEIALARLREARARVAAGESLDAVASDLGLAVRESEEFGAGGFVGGLGVNPELTAAALALQPGEVGEPIAHQGSAVLFQVTDRKTFQPEEFAAQKEPITRQLEQEQVQSLLSSLIQSRRQELGVNYDRQLLEAWNMLGEGQNPS